MFNIHYAIGCLYMPNKIRRQIGIVSRLARKNDLNYKNKEKVKINKKLIKKYKNWKKWMNGMDGCV